MHCCPAYARWVTGRARSGGTGSSRRHRQRMVRAYGSELLLRSSPTACRAQGTWPAQLPAGTSGVENYRVLVPLSVRAYGCTCRPPVRVSGVVSAVGLRGRLDVGLRGARQPRTNLGLDGAAVSTGCIHGRPRTGPTSAHCSASANSSPNANPFFRRRPSYVCVGMDRHP